jgi:hypothetical protein
MISATAVTIIDNLTIAHSHNAPGMVSSILIMGDHNDRDAVQN